MKRAVVLLSGGIDSTVTLYLAKKKNFDCFCLIFDYDQRHKREIDSAKKISRFARCKYKLLRIDLPWKGSALLDRNIKIPQHYNALTLKHNNIVPSTYVPARNIIFLSFALSCAEVVGAEAIFIGAHTQDYSGYPDCRQDFFNAFNKVIEKGTKTAVEGKNIKVLIPLIDKTKSEIIKLGRGLGVPFQLTWSCYKGGKQPCGICDSCYFRQKGFEEAGLKDPLLCD
ncbi:MAG: 7-cyano-7-deazaguanine synthase QueC [Candidatus Omnitrophica bacterium]|nr:7-cyano-7-deazaguanine synthase QueC [Candidatus Omnitrophota bacterium]